MSSVNGFDQAALQLAGSAAPTFVEMADSELCHGLSNDVQSTTANTMQGCPQTS